MIRSSFSATVRGVVPRLFEPGKARWWALYSLLVILNLCSFAFSLFFVDFRMMDRLKGESAYNVAWKERFREIADLERAVGGIHTSIRGAFLSGEPVRQRDTLRKHYEIFLLHARNLEHLLRGLASSPLRKEMLEELQEVERSVRELKNDGSALLGSYPSADSPRRLALIGQRHDLIQQSLLKLRARSRDHLTFRLYNEVQNAEGVERTEALFNAVSFLLLVGMVLIGYRSVVSLARSEREARANEERLELILASNGAGIMDVDARSGAVVGSEGFRLLHGIPATETGDLTLKAFLSYLPGPEQERFDMALREHLERQVPFRLDYRIQHREKGERWLRALGRGGWDKAGRPLRMVIYVSDVTEERAATTTLETSERRLKVALEGTSDCIWDWDLVSDTVFFSPKFATMLGYHSAEAAALVKNWKDLLHPEERDRLLENLKDNLAGRIYSFEMEHRLRSKNGVWVWILTRGKVIERDADGRALRMAGAFTDLSRLKVAEHSVRESEWRMKELMAMLPVGVILNDAEGHCNFVNQWWLELTGMSEQETLGFGWQNAIHPEDREAVFSEWAQSIRHLRPFSMQYRLIDSKGNDRWIIGNGIWLRDQSGRAMSFLGVVQDISSLKEAEGENEFYRAALDQADIVAITDARGTILHANDPFCQISGYERQELLGKNHRILNSGLMPAGFFQDLWKTISSGKTWKGEICNRAKDGHLYWVDTVIVPHVSHTGRPDKFIAIRRDVTGRKRQETELQQARERAEAATQAKSQFLANISHELRTPLNGVIGMAELLLESRMTLDQKELATTIQECGENLLTIVNELLDYSKIEAGKIEFEYAQFSLANCVQSVAGVLEHGATEKGLNIFHRIEPGVPGEVISDSGRLRQVLMNLAGNALKFTERGSISIDVGVHSAEEARLVLRFSVTDTGVGIPPEKMSKLFQAFSQGDASVSRRYGGTGLGLVISKQLVEAMGGRLWVESAPGKGSVFSFLLPVMSATAENRPLEAVPRALPNLAAQVPLRILLAEDNTVNQKLATKMLEKMGYRVDLAENGKVALAAVRREKYDLVLMDLQMPEMSGVESTVQIRADKAIHQPKIVALTANAMTGDRQFCLDAGMDGFVTKPIRREKFLEEIGRVFGLDSLPGDDTAAVESRGLEQLVEQNFMGDHSLFLEVVGSYVERRGALIDGLRQSLEAGLAADAQFRAHKLLGAISSFNNAEASGLLGKIEALAKSGRAADASALLPATLEALRSLDQFLENYTKQKRRAS